MPASTPVCAATSGARELGAAWLAVAEFPRSRVAATCVLRTEPRRERLGERLYVYRADSTRTGRSSLHADRRKGESGSAHWARARRDEPRTRLRRLARDSTVELAVLCSRGPTTRRQVACQATTRDEHAAVRQPLETTNRTDSSEGARSPVPGRRAARSRERLRQCR